MKQTAKRNVPGKSEVVHGAPHASTYVSGLLILCTAATPKFSHHISNFLFVHLHDIGMIRDFSTDNKTLQHVHLRCVTVGKIYIWELFFDTKGLFVGCWSVSSACMEVMWRFEQNPKYVDSLWLKSFQHAKRCYNEFGPQWTEIGCSHSNSNTTFKHAPEVGKVYDVVCKTTNRKSEDQLPTWRITLFCFEIPQQPQQSHIGAPLAQ